MGGTIMAIMWLGGHYVVGGSMLSGDLIAFFTYASEILMSLMMVAMVMMVLTRSIACGKRIVEVLEEQPEITDSAADPALTVESGEVDFDHVYFKYHKDSGAWNLEDVCLHIDSGMTVGILGGTGSAKSTLVSLIPGCMRPRRAPCPWADTTSGNTPWRPCARAAPWCCKEHPVLRHHPGKPPLGPGGRHGPGDGGGLPHGLRRRVYLPDARRLRYPH